MKLAKDKFYISNVKMAESQIKENIIEYMRQNNLYLSKSKYGGSLFLDVVQKQNTNYAEDIPNPSSYIRNNYFLLKETNPNLSQSNSNQRVTLTTNSAPGNSNSISDLYFFLYNKAKNENEKITLIKTLFHDFLLRYDFLEPILKKMNNEDCWFHLRHINPFESSTKSVGHIRTILTKLNQLSIDTPQKEESLMYGLQYYKQLCKRPDIQSGLIKLLRVKLSEEQVLKFEDFLKIKINEQDDKEVLFDNNNEIVTIFLNKEQLFKQLSFGNVPQAGVDSYNQYLKTLNSFLVSDEVKKTLGIQNIDMIDLSSKNHPARIYIQSVEDGFNGNINEIYEHLLRSCVNSLVPGWKQESLSDTFEKSLTYYQINKNLNDTHQTNDSKVIKKITKI